MEHVTVTRRPSPRSWRYTVSTNPIPRSPKKKINGLGVCLHLTPSPPATHSIVPHFSSVPCAYGRFVSPDFGGLRLRVHPQHRVNDCLTPCRSPVPSSVESRVVVVALLPSPSGLGREDEYRQ
ncbi:hypothetical protein MRB53_042394 [Persea americana]|nr:hypothetical protein MRB53_042394 [Persea americana]